MNRIKKFIIFLNGTYPRSVLHVNTQDAIEFPFIHKKNIVHDENTFLFAADNGFKKILKNEIPYSKLFLFGDFDSLSAHHLKKAKQSKNIELNILPKKKNISDFAAILDYIFANFSDEHPFYIEIYGGLGKDRAHEYANIKECEYFLSKSPHGGLIVLQGHVILSTLSFTLKHRPKREFSIFCTPHIHFSLTNSIYAGRVALTRPSHGISNCVKQSPLIIERPPTADVMTIIFR